MDDRVNARRCCTLFLIANRMSWLTISVPISFRYDVALLYLKNADWNLEAAIEAYKEDEQWEKAHPIEAHSKKKGKSARDVGMRRFVGASTTVSSSAR